MAILLSLLAIGCVTPLTNSRIPVRQALAQVYLPRQPEYTVSRESGQWVLEKNGEHFPLAGGGAASFEACGDPLAPAMVIFTSGSTGKSKGVILSQNNLIANLLASAPLGGYRQEDVALGALPMDHVFGLALLTGAIVLRHRLYLTAGKDLDSVLQVIQAQRITRMNGVPSLYLSMADHRGDWDLSSLRCGFIGGGPCTPAQFLRIEQELEMVLVPVYGMSECLGMHRIYPLTDQDLSVRSEDTAASQRRAGYTYMILLIGLCWISLLASDAVAGFAYFQF